MERSAMLEIDSTLSPAALLASFLLGERKPSELVILTGPSGCGKTRYCLELARLAAEQSLRPVGLASPPVLENGLKTGIDLLDLASGERRRLAAHRSLAEPGRPPAPGSLTREWQFDLEALAWGEAQLGRIGAACLLVLDELGPFELLDGRGWLSGMRLVDNRSYRWGCVTVRPSLLGTALERWPWARVMHVQPHSPFRRDA